MKRVLIARLAIPLACSLVSCQSAAIVEVRDAALEYQALVGGAPSTIHVEEIDGFLQELGDGLLIEAEALALELEVEQREVRSRRGRPGTDTEPSQRWIIREKQLADLEMLPYDSLDVFLVHSKAPNAATPGDNCAQVTTRLFLEVDEPEYIAAVIAHELGHIVDQHMIKQVIRRKQHSGLVGVVAAVGAAADGYNSASAQQYGYDYTPTDWGSIYQASIASYKPWRKADEYRADLIGLELYMRYGLDPDKFLGVFETLFAHGGDEESDTHPTLSSRIEKIEGALQGPDLPEAPSRVLDSERLAELQGLLARTLEGFGEVLPTNEEYLAGLIDSGQLARQLNCCGPITYDQDVMARQYEILLKRRLGE